MSSQKETENKVRMGIIGLGNMGTGHARSIKALDNVTLAAVCDEDRQRADKVAAEFGCAAFYEPRQMIESGSIDAVLIATPHYSHIDLGIMALEAGLHVLVEKPLGVHKADCEKLIAAHVNKEQVFALMFNQRTDPRYRKVKKLVADGELGEITRVNWVITDWFRTEAYYRSGSWRATWAGEGGGVLLNQCPHNLDLLQWICGMPDKITAKCYFGKRHNIEVEDEVTAILEYANGATGVFVASTGEAPGSNRLEICGDRGRVIIEGNSVNFIRNEVPAMEFSRTATRGFAKPETWNIDIPVQGTGGQHKEIIQNFADCILNNATLVAPAEEGINSVELGNAMIHSALNNKTVTLPLDGAVFAGELQALIEKATQK